MATSNPLGASDLLQALADRGGLLSGHFRLSSGRHSNRFVQKFRLLEDPHLLGQAVAELRGRLGALAPTVVVSAAVGGIVLGYELARQLGCRAIFVEKEAGVPTLRRGFELSAQDRVIIVEDVVTTGGSVREVLAIVQASGAQLEAVAIVVRRALIDFGLPTIALIDLPIESYDEADCPYCAAAEPLIDPGSRRLGR